MSNFRLLTAGCAVLLLTLVMGGCSDDDKKDSGSKDTTAPTVTSVLPQADATAVSHDTAITASFSEAMDATTITDMTFTVAAPGPTPVAGSVSYNATSHTATFLPASDLTASTTFTATVTTGVEDLAGNALAADFVWSFTTDTAPDTTPPTVSSTNPANTATDVAVNQAISAIFSEPLDPATVSTSSFTLMDGTTPVLGSVSSSGMTTVFTPLNVLDPLTVFTATLTTDIKDLAGNAMVAEYVWSFTTGAAPDMTPPTVSSTNPANTATDVPVNQAISAIFSESLDPATVNTTSFTLMDGTIAVAGSVSNPGMTAVFTPTDQLAPFTLFTATLTTEIEDLAGNALAADYVWTFTTGATPDTTPPTVTSTTPGDTATDVPVNQTITAFFSEALDPATVTTATFTLMDGTTAVAGSVTNPGMTAVFTPLNELDPFTLFTATLTTGIKDLAGNAMVADYVWSFTTGATPDTTPPTVTSTDPADMDTGVPVNYTITAVFSEPLDPTTVSTTSFTLLEGINAIAGTVTSPGTSAIFTPLNDLPAFTTFTARLTTAIKDLAGNPMAVDYVWSFQTGNIPATGPAPVVLGTAGNFVILAKSAVSVTGTTSIVGDIGLSPSAGSFFTGFSETMDASNEFSTSSIVTGRLYAADYAPPTPTTLTTAVSDMEIAYTDAAGRSNPDHTELGAGNIEGMTLTPGLYKWGTSVEFANGITLSGGANDVWIFQIAQDLMVGNGAIVTLSGGAQAKNIFWQVAGQTTLGTTSDVKGIVLCQTAIVLNTGAVLNGRALAQTAVTLDANDVTLP
jgi:tetrahydromethanopterin S-methyltransferase subunit B